MDNFIYSKWFLLLLLLLAVGSVYLNCSGKAAAWCGRHCAPAGFSYNISTGECSCVDLRGAP